MNNGDTKTLVQGFLRDAPDCYRGLEASPIITLDKPYMSSDVVQKVELVLDKSSIFDPRALLEGTDTSKSREDALKVRDIPTVSEKVTFLREQGYQAVAVAHIPYDPNREIVLLDTDTEIKPIAHDDIGINIEPHGKGFERLLEKNRLTNEYLSKTLPFDRNHSHVTIGTSLRGLSRIIGDSGTDNQSKKDVLYLDVASTGLNPRKDAIMEIAIIDDRNHTLFESLVHPERGIPPEAGHRYAITDDMINDAPTLKEITPQIKDILSSADQVMVYGSGGPEKLLPENVLASTRIMPVMNAFSDIHGSLNEPDLRSGNYPVQSLHLASEHVGYRSESGDLERSLSRAQALRAVWKWTEKQLDLLPENILSRSNEIITVRSGSNENQVTKGEVPSRFKDDPSLEAAIDAKQTLNRVADAPTHEQSGDTKARSVSSSLLDKVTAQGSMQTESGWVRVNVYEIYQRSSDDPFSKLSVDEQIKTLNDFPHGYDKVASVVANTDIDTVVELTSSEADWFRKGFVEPHVDGPRQTDTGDVIVNKNFRSPDTVRLVDNGLEVSDISLAIEKRSRHYSLFHREQPSPASDTLKDYHSPNLDTFPKGYTRVATFQGNRDPEGIEFLTREKHWPERLERLEGVEIHEKGARETEPGDILVERDNRGTEVFHILETDGIKELKTLENMGGKIENVDHSDHPKARNWIARVQPVSSGRERLQREFLPRAPKGRFVSEKIAVGDLLEFGGDHLTAQGERIKNRSYFQVLGIKDGLKIREIDPAEIYKDSESTLKHDPEAGGPLEKSESLDKIQAYRETTTKIGPHRSQGRYFTLDKSIEDQSRTYLGISEISIDKSRIYDPYGQIEGTEAAKSRENMDTIETTIKLRMVLRLEKDNSAAAKLAKAQIRAEVLSDYGYQAEAAVTVFKDGFTRDLVVISDEVSVKDLSKHMEEPIIQDPWPPSAIPGAVELLSNYMSEARMAEIGLLQMKSLTEDRSPDDPSHSETKTNLFLAERRAREFSKGQDFSSSHADLRPGGPTFYKDNPDKTDGISHRNALTGPEHLHENEHPLAERGFSLSYLDSGLLSPELVQVIQEQKADMKADQEMQIVAQPEQAKPREIEMEI